MSVFESTWRATQAAAGGSGLPTAAPDRQRAPRDRRRVPLDVRRARPLAGIVLLTAAYYAAAHVGYALEFAGPVAAVVWPPVGVAIAFLYIGGLRLWPGVLAGDLLVNDYGTLPVGTALAQTCGNLLEVLVAVVLLRRLSRAGSPLAGVRGIAGLLGAIVAGAAISATVGALSARAGGVVSAGDLGRISRTWFLGDASGALVLVPLALAWRRLPSRRWLRKRGLEAGLLLIALIAVAALVFGTDRPLAYLTFPGLLWAAVRFGQRGATAAILVTAGVAVWSETHYMGAFTFQAINHMILTTQLFIAVAALSTLVLAAVVTEREDLAVALDASRFRVVEAADAARRRVERDLHDGAQGRLAALAVRLGIAAERVERHEPLDSTRVLSEAQRELEASIEEIRLLSQGVHPTVLTELGLAEAMIAVSRRSAVPVRLLDLPEGRLDDAVEATAYFMLTEAITNAARHARATHVDVRAALNGASLRLEVVDDGVGGAIERAGDGLSGLRERVEAMGGTFEIDSPPGLGTRLRGAIPLST
jgi:signal transduction histidine kinase